ncbi:MAG: hypothetical protein CMJ80_03140 [Planctomycetaceae bacterium]|nr:hypothetical protein [Planctomycetaceae bacterium]
MYANTRAISLEQISFRSFLGTKLTSSIVDLRTGGHRVTAFIDVIIKLSVMPKLFILELDKRRDHAQQPKCVKRFAFVHAGQDNRPNASDCDRNPCLACADRMGSHVDRISFAWQREKVVGWQRLS